jgi:hypothetical protein
MHGYRPRVTSEEPCPGRLGRVLWLPKWEVMSGGGKQDPNLDKPQTSG